MTWEVIFLASPGHATPDKPQGSTTFHFTATMQCSTISMQLLHGPKQTSRTAAGEAEIHHEGPETREKILNLMTNVIPIPWPAPCVARGCRIREFHRLGPPNKANWPQAKRAKQSQSSPGEITANPIYCKWLRHNTRVVPPGKQSQLAARPSDKTKPIGCSRPKSRHGNIAVFIGLSRQAVAYCCCGGPVRPVITSRRGVCTLGAVLLEEVPSQADG